MNISDIGPSSLPGNPGETAQQRDPQPAAHQVGQWPKACRTSSVPPTDPGESAWLAYQAERAERIVILGRIGAHLEAEPTARSVRAAGRRWSAYIASLADQIAEKLESTKEAK